MGHLFGVHGSASEQLVAATGSSRRRSLGRRFADFTSVADHGAKGNGVSVDSDAFTRAIAKAPTGGIVFFPPGKTYFMRGIVTIDKSLTIWAYGATLHWSTSAASQGCDVTASEVTILGGEWKGPQKAASVATQIGIHAYGADVSNYINNIVIKDVYAHNWGYAGIQGGFVEFFDFSENRLADCYSFGILTTSSRFGATNRNRVKDIVADGVVGTNAYGISHTKNNGTQAAQPVPQFINCNDNVIEGMLTWVGLDCHGGNHMNYVGNTVRNCRSGISIVSYSATATDETNPSQIVITGNNISRVSTEVSDADVQSGIIVSGTTANSATAGTGITITGNNIDGHGDDSGNPTSAVGAIEVQFMDGLTVTGNTVRQGQTVAYRFFSGTELVCSGNYAHDLTGTVSASASGAFTFSGNPTDGDTITVNGAVFTYRNSPSGNYEIQIEASQAATEATTATDLNNSQDARVALATYADSGSTVTVTADKAGRGFNGVGFTLAESSSVITTANLSGGTHTGPTAFFFDILSGGSACSGIVSNNLADVGTYTGFGCDGDHTSLHFSHNRHTSTGTLYDLQGSTTDPNTGAGEIYRLDDARVTVVIPSIGAGSSWSFYAALIGLSSVSSTINWGSNITQGGLVISLIPGRNFVKITLDNPSAGAINPGSTNFYFSGDQVAASSVTVIGG